MVSKPFDPQGLLLYVTVKSRIFLQGLWKLKTSWDQTLPDKFCDQQDLLNKELKTTSETQILRITIIQLEADCKFLLMPAIRHIELVLTFVAMGKGT